MSLRKHTHSAVLLHLGFDLWRGIFLSLLSFPVLSIEYYSLHCRARLLRGEAKECFP